jgi:hypothetical protein
MRPSWPALLSPTHDVSPAAVAEQEAPSIATTVAPASWVAASGTGLRRKALPVPSCANRFAPQHSTCCAAVRPHTCTPAPVREAESSTYATRDCTTLGA